MLVVGSVAASAMINASPATQGVRPVSGVRFGPSQQESPGTSTKTVTPVQRTEYSARQISFTNPALITTLQDSEATDTSRPYAKQNLSEDDLKQIERLKQRDAEVRRHEAAHKTAGGTLAGSPTYTYQDGPDGKKYAIGGEVKIDSSPVKGDPEATIAKMDIVIRAALAPEEPSARDRRVAAKAQRQKIQAQKELQQQQNTQFQGEDTNNGSVSANVNDATQRPTIKSGTRPLSPQLDNYAIEVASHVQTQGGSKIIHADAAASYKRASFIQTSSSSTPFSPEGNILPYIDNEPSSANIFA